MLILADALVVEPGRVLRPGRLRVSGRMIREVGSDLRAQPGEDLVELPGVTLAPGFINLHAHLELGPLHGKIRAGLPFADWLNQILSLRASLHANARTASMLESSRLAAETGTTTILNVLSDPEALAGLAGTLPRIWWALEFMDLHGNPQPSVRMERMAAWLSRHPGANWKSALSPHSPYTATADLYRECAKLSAELRVPFTTHWGESVEEEELFQHGGGTLRSLLPDSWSPGSLADRMEALPAGSLIAHGNQLTEKDLPRLGTRGCFVIHCPSTHSWFGRGPFPIERFRQHRIPVVLGTDSPASSDNRFYDLRVEARALRGTHPQISMTDVWTMLTTLPARALGQESRLGCLRPEAEADWVGWKIDPSADPVAAILESTGPAEMVSVAGRLHRPERV